MAVHCTHVQLCILCSCVAEPCAHVWLAVTSADVWLLMCVRRVFMCGYEQCSCAAVTKLLMWLCPVLMCVLMRGCALFSCVDVPCAHVWL